MSDSLTREMWLESAVPYLVEIIEEKEGKFPEKYKVSVGFPSGSARAIGQAWDKECSSDGETGQMFISPVLGVEDPVQLLQVLLHEMIHLAVGIDQKHGGEFKRLARDIGLEGRLTATYVSQGSDLYNRLKSIYEEIESQEGSYPHVTLKPKLKPKKEREKSYVVCVSQSNVEFKVKVPKKVIDEIGLPYDPWGEELIVLEDD